MRAVLQRVREAEVRVGSTTVGRIGGGFLILLGIEVEDNGDDLEWLAGKIVRLRVFPDEAGGMNRSVLETGGGLLLVSQFTLLASTRKGTRPSWDRAARPEIARSLFEAFQRRLEALAGRPVPTGVFGAEMQIDLVNDGPVTLVMDSRRRE